MILARFEAFSFDSSLGRSLMLEQVEGDAVDDGEVLGSVASSFTAEVFVEATSSTQCSSKPSPQVRPIPPPSLSSLTIASRPRLRRWKRRYAVE